MNLKRFGFGALRLPACARKGFQCISVNVFARGHLLDKCR